MFGFGWQKGPLWRWRYSLEPIPWLTWGKCKYNNDGSCNGASERRTNSFVCDFVDEYGNILETGHVRNPMDLTGNMKVIMEA